MGLVGCDMVSLEWVWLGVVGCDREKGIYEHSTAREK